MQDQHWDALWINALLATCEQSYGLIRQGAIAAKDGKIAWIGTMKELVGYQDRAKHIYDVNDYCLTPGLIDCHTHLIYGGNRFSEFIRRLQGATYEEIAAQGGGIQSTVLATRKLSESELFQQTLPRIRTALANGVTTIEIKSGYGLDLATELKILRTAKKLEEYFPITIKKTFLGAHSIPIEYKKNPDDYIKLICQEMIPQIASEKLADAVDVFCETIAFNLEQTEQVFQVAQEYGLDVKCHAEQLSNQGATQLAIKYQAISVDHLEHLVLKDIVALAQSDTVAVLLPGAFYFLREKVKPPVDLLRQHHIRMAIATDANPGTSPVLSLLNILNMACIFFNLTPEEALSGVTLHAAQALKLNQTHGSLSIGKDADFAIWQIEHPGELAYYMGFNPLYQLVKKGKVIPETL